MFYFQDPAVFGTLTSQTNNRLLSPLLWNRAAGGALSVDGKRCGFGVMDDFNNFPAFAPGNLGTETWPATTGGGPGSYGAFIEASTTAGFISQVTDAPSTIRLNTGNTDNSECLIHSNYLGELSDTRETVPGDGLGERSLTIFEARIRVPTITDKGAFVGLGDAGMTVTGGLVADTSLVDGANVSAVGFRIGNADPDGIDFVYSGGGTGENVLINELQAAAVGSFYKLGFVYDPFEPTGNKRLAVYLNGVEQSTYITEAIVGSAEFPDSDLLKFVAIAKTGTTASTTLDLDWWAFWQNGAPV